MINSGWLNFVNSLITTDVLMNSGWFSLFIVYYEIKHVPMKISIMETFQMID